MTAAHQPPAAVPRRRVPAQPAVPQAAASKAARPTAARKPRPATKTAATEATAAAFLVLFKTLPAAVKSRIVALIDDYEDELDEQEIAADQLAHPENYDPANSISWKQVKSELDKRDQRTGGAASKQAA